ncbi:MAG: hypothetical protein LBQ93_01835 [Treponema sp.]|nr:hypothetical protein [Treponema sp.]
MEIEISNYYNGNLYFKLNPSDKIKLNNNDLINSAVILVKAKHNLKYLGYGEYDHWFPIKHRLKIDIDNNEIVFNNDRMAYRELANSYEEYDEYKEYEEYLLNQKYKK